MDTASLTHRVLRALETHHNVLLYGPPGTGKSYLLNKIKAEFLQPTSVLLRETADTDFFEAATPFARTCPQTWWITFHQSYAYEDFVVGLRTTPGPGFLLTPQQGPLLEATEHARTADGSSLLLIDEINRGNTSRIFGELITLMESTKRLDAAGNRQADTVELYLPNISGVPLSFNLNRPCEEAPRTVTVPAPFTMPHHVYILATMNSVDKTVAPLDAALRRRFYVVEIEPDYEILSAWFGFDWDAAGAPLPSRPDILTYWQQLAVRMLYQTNLRIRSLMSADFQLGHSYLLPLTTATSVAEFRLIFQDVINSAVLPQLRELLRSNSDALAAVLAVRDGEGSTSNYPFAFEDIGAELSDIGGRPPLRIAPVDATQLETVARRFASLS